MKNSNENKIRLREFLKSLDHSVIINRRELKNIIEDNKRYKAILISICNSIIEDDSVHKQHFTPINLHDGGMNYLIHFALDKLGELKFELLKATNKL